MPKSAHYLVSWSPEQEKYLFIEQGNGVASSVPEGESWQQWLGEHCSFSFHGRNGQINVLKEKRGRGGDGYWYAYQRQGK